MKRKPPIVLIAVLMFVGICVFLYPAVSNMISRMTSSVKIAGYQAVISKLDEVKRRNALKEAQEYNAKLSGVITTDAFSVKDHVKKKKDSQYESLLNINGIMGYVEIPSIKVYLPIYHGTSNDVLQKGAGHLEGSALPVGGPGTNAVITAHRGLPAAKLFTDIDQLEIGDMFYLHVLNETMAYRIDKISVVDPGDTKELNAVPGEDHATLLTCTPYGINSQRMLVRGSRVENPSAISEAGLNLFTIKSELRIVSLWVIVPAGILLFLLFYGMMLLKRKIRKI